MRPHHYYPTVVGITVALHLVWATGLFFNPSSIHATALHAMFTLTGDPFLGAIIFGTVALLAVLGLMAHEVRDQVLLILPQHTVLWVSAVGAGWAMYSGQYADGTERDHWFIVVDQVPIILLALGHTVALVFISRRNHYV